MSINSEDVKKLSSIFKSNKIEPFIRKIVFTNFKNIAKKQEITFDYPITAFVGQNGTNKTSALVALYGAVDDKTPAEYWFTTPIDAIKSNSDKKDAYQSYFYTYNDKQYVAEVLLINNQRSDRGIDYWETDKPKKHLGMNVDLKNIESDSKVSTRWKKIKKNVIYINFRSELSSFDRCLYHANKPSKAFKTKQDYIRSKSINLKKAITNNLNSLKLNRKEKININRSLSKDEVRIVSLILNKKYSSIKYIEHSFFDVTGGTAYIENNGLVYSEAYAGSGEYAVISLVNKVMSAKDNSLILLDEPEVSLHPQAQKNLIYFLNQEVMKNKHQIVISTHSPEIIECLPDKAIKLFMENISDNSVVINNSVSKCNVFHAIGKKFTKIPVYVEDKLAKAIIDRVMKEEPDLKNNFEVTLIPGGANSISILFSVLSEVTGTQLILLDGDQESDLYKNKNDFPDSEDIPNKDLTDTIKALKFNLFNFKDSNSKSFDQERKFVDSLGKYVAYLPFDSPEYFLLNENNMANKFLTNLEAKSEIRKITEKELGVDYATSHMIFFTQLRLLNQINIDCLEFKKIKHLLDFYLKNGSLRGWVNDFESKLGV
ncbi:MAG TPA: hypothetical protein DIT05_09790 [Morganella sp. (in: Bacteria)]|nr:hypothetical protein [Morganella sp. (in: enterobacteria)]